MRYMVSNESTIVTPHPLKLECKIAHDQYEETDIKLVKMECFVQRRANSWQNASSYTVRQIQPQISYYTAPIKTT